MERAAELAGAHRTEEGGAAPTTAGQVLFLLENTAALGSTLQDLPCNPVTESRAL